MVKLVNGIESTYERLKYLMAEIGAGLADPGRLRIPASHKEEAKAYLRERGYVVFGYSMTDKEGNLTIFVNRRM